MSKQEFLELIIDYAVARSNGANKESNRLYLKIESIVNATEKIGGVK